MLEQYINDRLKQKDILFMTHIVLGYPSFDKSLQIIESMVEAGVDLMELQIPFSEPTADGPVIVRANQSALDNGATVKDCLALAEKAAHTFDIPFLIMSYYNILFKYGVDEFVSNMSDVGLKGAIVPDLPPEEGQDYLNVMQKYHLAPILIYSPTTSLDRMKYINEAAEGFIYCMARKGVTGQNTTFSDELAAYINQCRKATSLPLAIGFGVQEKVDVDFLRGKADIAVIGTQTIRVMEEKGVEAVGDFIQGLR